MRVRVPFECEFLTDVSETVEEILKNRQAVDRIKVYGGWIVRTWAASNKGQIIVDSCFVPDKDHVWNTQPKSDPVKEAASKISEGY